MDNKSHFQTDLIEDSEEVVMSNFLFSKILVMVVLHRFSAAFPY